MKNYGLNSKDSKLIKKIASLSSLKPWLVFKYIGILVYIFSYVYYMLHIYMDYILYMCVYIYMPLSNKIPRLYE